MFRLAGDDSAGSVGRFGTLGSAVGFESVASAGNRAKDGLPRPIESVSAGNVA